MMVICASGQIEYDALVKSKYDNVDDAGRSVVHVPLPITLCVGGQKRRRSRSAHV